MQIRMTLNGKKLLREGIRSRLTIDTISKDMFVAICFSETSNNIQKILVINFDQFEKRNLSEFHNFGRWIKQIQASLENIIKGQLAINLIAETSVSTLF